MAVKIIYGLINIIRCPTVVFHNLWEKTNAVLPRRTNIRIHRNVKGKRLFTAEFAEKRSEKQEL